MEFITTGQMFVSCARTRQHVGGITFDADSTVTAHFRDASVPSYTSTSVDAAIAWLQATAALHPFEGDGITGPNSTSFGRVLMDFGSSRIWGVLRCQGGFYTRPMLRPRQEVVVLVAPNHEKLAAIGDHTATGYVVATPQRRYIRKHLIGAVDVLLQQAALHAGTAHQQASILRVTAEVQAAVAAFVATRTST